MQIPVIDISSLVNESTNSKEFNKTINQIKNACQNIGFFLIKNHGISNEIINDIWSDTSEFFDLQLHQKNIYYSNDQINYPYGYMGIGYENLNAGTNHNTTILPDLKESFSIGNPLTQNIITKWPSSPKNFKKSWNIYYQKMVFLVDKILEAFAISLNLDKDFFKKYTNKHSSALRALNYPEIKGYNTPENQIRASPHTDYGTITILKTDGPGLQVQIDSKWIDVPIIDDTFIINIGDIMQRWTNDMWSSTVHQVIKVDNTNERRQSIAFFHNPNNDALIEPILKNELTNYKPIIAKDFIMKKHISTLRRG